MSPFLQLLLCSCLFSYVCSAIPRGVQFGGFVRDGKVVYTAKKVDSPRDLWEGKYTVPDYFDGVEVIKHLYGRHFDPRNNTGRGGIYVFGNHNTGTSMLTRLVMLLGAFQGNLEGLSTSPTNRLKYWEKLAVSHFHDMLLRKYSSPRFKPYHAQGLDLSTLTQEDRHRIDMIAEKVIQDQDRHQPWVLKDPRMLFFAEPWIQKTANPVCLITYKEPIGNAISLSGNAKKSAQNAESDEMTVERWLDAWEKGILSVLFACMGQPTVLVEAESLKADIGSVAKLVFDKLEAAGVKGLYLPSDGELNAEFGAYLKPSRGKDADLQGIKMTPTQEALDFAFRKVLDLARDDSSFDVSNTVSVLLDIWKSSVSSRYQETIAKS